MTGSLGLLMDLEDAPAVRLHRPRHEQRHGAESGLEHGRGGSPLGVQVSSSTSTWVPGPSRSVTAARASLKSRAAWRMVPSTSAGSAPVRSSEQAMISPPGSSGAAARRAPVVWALRPVASSRATTSSGACISPSARGHGESVALGSRAGRPCPQAGPGKAPRTWARGRVLGCWRAARLHPWLPDASSPPCSSSSSRPPGAPISSLARAPARIPPPTARGC